MISSIKKLLAVLVLVLITAVVWITQFQYQTQRDGELSLDGLVDSVTVQYNEFGVPRIEAKSEADLYFALGYVHAQDRLFQMELMRRLAQGQLAEMFGEKLVDTDRLFRTVGIHRHAKQYVADIDKSSDSWRALEQYVAGVNAFQDQGNLPVEFDVLGLTPRPFKPEDSISVSGYLAYSFAVGFRTEPVMTFIADQLGEEYLAIFDLDMPAGSANHQLNSATYESLAKLGIASILDQELGQLEGSNAWAISGSQTKNGKPILASDPHISFSAPGVWYEAHLVSGDYEFYGFHQALVPVALMGHNRRFGWGVTMFQNDDMDFYLEQVNPQNVNQVKREKVYEDLALINETIQVKDSSPVDITVRTSSIGPIINDVYKGFDNAQPVSLWWAFLKTPNPLMNAFYELSRAESVEAFGEALKQVHAPGLNFVYADTDDNIAWWSAGLVPVRPDHVAPWKIMDGSSNQDLPTGFYDFSYNPHKLNPPEGFIVSANQRPDAYEGVMVPGYYNLPARAELLIDDIAGQGMTNLENEKSNQLNIRSEYAADALSIMLAELDPAQKQRLSPELLDALGTWQGAFTLDSVAATLFTEWQFALFEQTFADELGVELFKLFIRTRRSDHGFYQLIGLSENPWWSNQGKAQSRKEVVNQAFDIAMSRLTENLGVDSYGWQWSEVHLFEQKHPLGSVQPLNHLFNLGPVAVDGSHAVPNNLSQKLSTGMQWVTSGPSTRRLLDFSAPQKSLSILPGGQSGNPFDHHYDDQAATYVRGEYREVDLDAEAASVLILKP
ncbi:penicillin acylase family protein [Endozoicomonas ascidiicola]|uniref:penicillin acylase family protein n=1 Tax=Endozoicomonas ascidiicola TaxID=1698521 RepID=UPI000831B587|nr:penicillin acylase family protein [Endozoicomonas ascidiicola]